MSILYNKQDLEILHRKLGHTPLKQAPKRLEPIISPKTADSTTFVTSSGEHLEFKKQYNPYGP